MNNIKTNKKDKLLEMLNHFLDSQMHLSTGLTSEQTSKFPDKPVEPIVPTLVFSDEQVHYGVYNTRDWQDYTDKYEIFKQQMVSYQNQLLNYKKSINDFYLNLEKPVNVVCTSPVEIKIISHPDYQIILCAKNYLC